ncbi:MAG TPA: SRPBCC family protein [Solirubrobacteraceae bacterium]|nr:SRPBCC family protein [Solirubrobacteraceae bacterium]
MRGDQVLQRAQRLPAAPEEVFAFFADARNLEALTPPLLRFRVITREPIAMARGTLIRYRLRVRGVPVSWLTEITEWEPPHHFVDEQREGPYALWHHTHSFASIADGDTLMRDVVRYRIGFGALGLIANHLVVRRDLERIFDFRAQRIPALLSAVGGSGGEPTSLRRPARRR